MQRHDVCARFHNWVPFVKEKQGLCEGGHSQGQGGYPDLKIRSLTKEFASLDTHRHDPGEDDEVHGLSAAQVHRALVLVRMQPVDVNPHGEGQQVHCRLRRQLKQ